MLEAIALALLKEADVPTDPMNRGALAEGVPTPIHHFGSDPADAVRELTPLLPSSETDLQFYSRRAMAESRAAMRATCPQAAAAHRYLAAAYAGLVRHEIEVAAELDALARDID